MKRILVALLLAAACTPKPSEHTVAPDDGGAPPMPGDRERPRVETVHRTPTAEQLAIVAAPDRLRDDTVLDAGRKPAELLAFLDLHAGMQVAELMAGYGYTTELIGRAVGPSGKVYALNNRFVLERFLEPAWTERLALPQMANVVRLDRELEHPFPAEVKDLDMVVMVLFYHDTYWQKTDRAAMNAAIFAVLKPGGSYVIVDHSARLGAGAEQVQTLHRVEEALVREEIEDAGFVLTEQADFLRNDDDARDWNASPAAAEQAGRRGTSDRFVLRFVKPRPRGV
jgi:predicted methyltransferase